MTSTGSETTSTTRSDFVTAVAWIFIAISGFSTLMSLFQNLMITFAFPVAEMHVAAQQGGNGQPMPAFFRFILGNIRLFFLFFLAISALTLVASIGLLKRKNWARIAFIGILAFGIVWNLGGMVAGYVLFASMPTVPENAPDEFQRRFDLFSMGIMVFSALFAVAMAGLCGWIIKRLSSSDIKREFA